MGKKILVTGATGFIGRNVAEYYAHKGYDVTGIFYNSEPYKCQNITLIRQDLTKPGQLERHLEGVEMVIHAAAVTSGVKDIVENPHIHISDTTLINTNVLKAAFNKKVPHFIFLSCTVMYQSSATAIKEDDFDLSKPITDKYFAGGWMKVYFEKICEFYSGLSNSKFTVVRHSNIYGPHDKFNSEKSHVFAATISKVMKADHAITVWGDGGEKRDFLYIQDLCDFIHLAEAQQVDNFKIFNVGLGKGTSIAEFVEKVISASGKELTVEFDTSKPNIPVDIFLNCIKAETELGWVPKTELDEGIAISIQWYRENFE